MRIIGLQTLTATAVIVIAGCAGAPAAQAGAWRFEPSRCPDLVEDYRDRRESRRDRRVNNGPLDRIEDRIDRRESRRDERVTVCPASAWVWDGPRRYRTARPAAAAVYYDGRDRAYFRYGPKRARVTVVVR
ncbi:MAG: hypothetical protein AAGD92_10300 [Pseudomonadota bacterium]